MRTQLKHSIYMAIFMHIAALICCLIGYYKLMEPGIIQFDSDLFWLMAILPAMLIGYAWVMVILEYFGYPEIFTGELTQAEIQANALYSVRWSDKHATTARVMEK